MKNDLKNLMNILLEEDLSFSIYDDTEKVDTLAAKLNGLLDISANTNDELKTKHISETVIAPLPFYGIKNDEKFDFVFMSLAPAYDASKIHLEKQAAGDRWKQYFDFYTSNAFIDHIKDDNLSYFVNVSKLLYAMTQQHDNGRISIEDIKSKMDVEKNQILGTLLQGKNVLFPQIVPFHSVGFETNMNGINQLRENMPSYDKYLNALIDYVKSTTKENGLIFTNGFGDSKVLGSLLLADGADVILENQLLSIQKWDTKWIVLLNDQPFTRYGLRSDLELDVVITQIIDITREVADSVNTLDAYCKNLVEKRAEEDFKTRGHRIKGAKLQKLSVKKLR